MYVYTSARKKPEIIKAERSTASHEQQGKIKTSIIYYAGGLYFSSYRLLHCHICCTPLPGVIASTILFTLTRNGERKHCYHEWWNYYFVSFWGKTSLMLMYGPVFQYIWENRLSEKNTLFWRSGYAVICSLGTRYNMSITDITGIASAAAARGAQAYDFPSVSPALGVTSVGISLRR